VNRSVSVFLAGLATVLISDSALADMTIAKSKKAELSAGLEIGAFYGHTENANFGVGVLDFHSSQLRPPRVDQYEAYFKPALKGHVNTENHGTVYSRLSAVGALSRGDGDAAGVTRGSEEDIDLEELVFGWRSGNLTPTLGKDAIDFSIGAQEFKIGDGFLVWDGNNDAFQDGAYWLIPRNAFEESAVLRFNTKPIRGDVFYLRADRDHDRAQFAGLNVEYIKNKFGTIGGAYMNFFDAENSVMTRDGMQLADVRFKFDTIPYLPNVTFAGEYAKQFGETRGRDINAFGWHLTGRYDFKNIPWKPYIRYRYAQFSGDDPGTPRQEKFDSLFYGYSDYGDWYQGEISSNGLLPNENQRNHMVHVSASPREWLRLDAMYYRFYLDNKFFNSTATTKRHFSDEVNLSFEIYLSEKSSIGALFSVAMPGKAAVQSIGGNNTTQALKIFLIYNF